MRSLAVVTVAFSLMLGWQTGASAQQAPTTTPAFGGPGVAHVGDKGPTPPQRDGAVKNCILTSGEIAPSPRARASSDGALNHPSSKIVPASVQTWANVPFRRPALSLTT